MAPQGDDHYHPVDAVSNGVKGALVTGGFGVFVAAIQNSLAKRNVGAWAVFTKRGGVIMSFAAAGGVYEFSRRATANLREKNDHYNEAVGGFLGGATMALRARSMPQVLGWGVFTAVALTVYDYTGSQLWGAKKWSGAEEVDEFDRKEWLRKNRRRPIEETIAELGEGRAIHPPGYEERRRARLKEKYGVEINPVRADGN